MLKCVQQYDCWVACYAFPFGWYRDICCDCCLWWRWCSCSISMHTTGLYSFILIFVYENILDWPFDCIGIVCKCFSILSICFIHPAHPTFMPFFYVHELDFRFSNNRYCSYFFFFFWADSNAIKYSFCYRIDTKLLIVSYAKGTTCCFCCPFDFSPPPLPLYRSHVHISSDFDWKRECFVSKRMNSHAFTMGRVSGSLHEHPRSIIMHGWRKSSHSNHCVHVCIWAKWQCKHTNNAWLLFTSLLLAFHFFICARLCRVEGNENNIIDGSCQCEIEAALDRCYVWSIDLS